jgi:hypothetical protein
MPVLRSSHLSSTIEYRLDVIVKLSKWLLWSIE